MARGKSYAQFLLDGRVIPAVVSYTGGGTNPKTRDVPDTKRPGSMRKEFTGGYEFEDLELEVSERDEEGIYLEEAYELFTAWRDGKDASSRRKNCDVAFFEDEKFAKRVGTLSLQEAWAITVGTIEFDASSDDARTFSVTITHLGSSYKSAVAASGVGVQV